MFKDRPFNFLLPSDPRAVASATPAGQEKWTVKEHDWACPGAHSRLALFLLRVDVGLLSE